MKRIRLMVEDARFIHQEMKHHLGWEVFIVGGMVRDFALGKRYANDIDAEVWGPRSTEELMDGLRSLGWEVKSTEVGGRGFPVVFAFVRGQWVEFALPRTEVSTGSGHQDFEVVILDRVSDENIVTAQSRRDFTVNSLMWQYPFEECNIIDNFNGVEHARNKVLHRTSDAFAEDPLRVFRGAVLIARHGLVPTEQLVEVCKALAPQASTVAKERIREEMTEMLLASLPVQGLEFLKRVNWLPWELCRLVGVPQDPSQHPEGDVWEHTMLAVEYCSEHFEDEQVIWAVLLHDIGKAVCSLDSVKVNGVLYYPDWENGEMLSNKGDVIPFTEWPDLVSCWAGEHQIRSWGHDLIGSEIAREFMVDYKFTSKDTRAIEALVRFHMQHVNKFTPAGASRLLSRLCSAGVTAEQWAEVVECDASARPPLAEGLPRNAQAFLGMVGDTKSTDINDVRILRGGMVLEEGIQPGPIVGEILSESLAAQMEGKIVDENTARAWLSSYLQGMNIA